MPSPGAARAVRVLGGAAPRVIPVQVTGLTDRRVVVEVQKVSATPPQYPRRAGVPGKMPL